MIMEAQPSILVVPTLAAHHIVNCDPMEIARHCLLWRQISRCRRAILQSGSITAEQSANHEAATVEAVAKDEPSLAEFPPRLPISN